MERLLPPRSRVKVRGHLPNIQPLTLDDASGPLVAPPKQVLSKRQHRRVVGAMLERQQNWHWIPGSAAS